MNCSDNNRSCTIEWVSRGERDEIIWLSFFHVIKINEHIFGDAEIFSELISSHWSVCVMKKCKPGKVKLFILTFPIGMSNLFLSWEVVFYLPKVSVLFEQKQRVTNNLLHLKKVGFFSPPSQFSIFSKKGNCFTLSAKIFCIWFFLNC